MTTHQTVVITSVLTLLTSENNFLLEPTSIMVRETDAMPDRIAWRKISNDSNPQMELSKKIALRGVE